MEGLEPLKNAIPRGGRARKLSLRAPCVYRARRFGMGPVLLL